MNSGIFDYSYRFMPSILFFFGGVMILGFVQPRRTLEWRSIVLFFVFCLALITGIYGLFTVHMESHLFRFLMTLGAPVATVWTVGSLMMAMGGYLVIRSRWLFHRKREQLIVEDLYQHIRHPQYLGFLFITVGMLVQWPSILVITTWSILILTYYKLARREEHFMETLYGEYYAKYRAQTPMFFPVSVNSRSGIHFSGEDQ